MSLPFGLSTGLPVPPLLLPWLPPRDTTVSAQRSWALTCAPSHDATDWISNRPTGGIIFMGLPRFPRMLSEEHS
ncbi:hypothetical protein SCLCIDRAFT_1221711 [Scleroderma citrinum Foug A]|uniref:Uncharacterized protein n=1 Tax=Scleroderma citrinum Foug A TaxID=1036808 RepID=A0A0C3DFB8_9AGAM|nr:hypothetical protein SCLCIDRAFT_1221711 [Scleroderma citrinum Foug A]